MTWQPIDTAPEDGRRLLLFDREIVTGCWGEGYTHGWEDHRGHHVAPTHWMPLPEPPQ